MSLRRKTFLILAVTFLLYAMLDSAIFRLVIYPSYREQEEISASRDMEAVLDRLDDMLDDLDHLAVGFAHSDATCTFVADGNAAYPTNRFSPAVFTDNHVDAVWVLGTNGTPLLLSCNDPDAGVIHVQAEGDIPIAPSHPLIKRTLRDGRARGLLETAGRHALVAGATVLSSNADGPPRGILVMVRYVSEGLHPELGATVDGTVTLRPAAPRRHESDVHCLPLSRHRRSAVLDRLSNSAIACRVDVIELGGRRGLELRLDLARDLHARATHIRHVATWSAFVGGLLFMLVALVLLETTVISRVHRLGQAVSRIASTQDLSTRLPISENDELGRLTGGINLMLAALEQSGRQLRVGEERYRTLFESSNDGIFLVHEDRFMDCNPRVLMMFGCERGRIIGGSPDQFLPETQPDGGRSKDLLAARMERSLSGMAQFFEWQFVRCDGSEFVTEVNLSRLGLQGSDHLLLVVRDVTERRVAEQRYRSLFREMLSGFALHELICDEHGAPCDYRFLEVNPAFEKLTGLKSADVVGKRVMELMPNTERHWVERYGEVALTGTPTYFEQYSESLGRYFEVSAFSPVKGRFATIFRDITDRKRIEEERRRMTAKFQQAQKLESLGVLAGGIAHDFNNLLVGILGNADLALDDVSEDSPARPCLKNIEEASKRAAELCRQMLAYSGKGRLTIGPIDVGRLLSDMRRLLEISIGKSVVIKYNIADGVPLVEGDSAQLRQIIMSLVTNASEAIGDRSGIVSVATGSMLCDRDYLAAAYVDDALPAGTYVFVEVADTGCGMDDETFRQVFDPFFTTKFIGRGLGLATVLGIVRGHRGAIHVETKVGSGSKFRVLFPAVADVVPAPGELPPAEEEWRASGAVLLADDDETVRSVGHRMLTRMGYEVVLAEDGREALQFFKDNEFEIVCVILDLTMPHMGGEETLRKLRAMNVKTPIIVSSGYDEEEVISLFGPGELTGFVQKPYKAEVFQSAVRRAIEGR